MAYEYNQPKKKNTASPIMFFLVFGILFYIFSVVAYFLARSNVHEIYATLLMLNGTLCIIAAVLGGYLKKSVQDSTVFYSDQKDHPSAKHLLAELRKSVARIEAQILDNKEENNGDEVK